VPPEPFADIRRAAEAEYQSSLESKYAFMMKSHSQPLRLARYIGRAFPIPRQFKRNVDFDVVVKFYDRTSSSLSTRPGSLTHCRRLARSLSAPSVAGQTCLRLLADLLKILYEETDYLAEGRNG